jgi:hypothetical protein
MRQPIARVSAAFAAGAVGAVVNSFALQLAGRLQPGAAPEATPEWIYQRLVWGGLWGLLFLLPILPGRPVVRGLLVSLAPSLARLTVFAPEGASADVKTVIFVLLFNAIWGVVAALWYEAVAETGASR